MSGINLSQSIQEKQALARGTFFDKGFFINTAIFLLVVGLYGGSQWYLGTLEDTLAILHGDASTKIAGLKGNAANQAADLAARLKVITANLESVKEPNTILGELERFTIADIRVTNYSYGEEKQAISISGVTTNLKYLAQQMLSYKKMTNVSSVHVEAVGYSETGQIEFTLELPLTQPIPSTVTP